MDQVFLKDVPRGELLEVETNGGIYTVEVLDPGERKLKIQGGKYFPNETEVILRTVLIKAGLKMFMYLVGSSDTVVETAKVVGVRLKL